MVSLFWIFSLSMCIFCLIELVKKFLKGYKYNDTLCIRYTALFSMFGILSIIIAVWLVLLANLIRAEPIIDEQIATYESQNLNIENEINTVLEDYDIKPDDESEDIIDFVLNQPELETNTSLQPKIEEYSRNREELQKLKAKKMFLPEAKWELYFGR